MNTKKFFAAFAILGLFVSCAQIPPTDGHDKCQNQRRSCAVAKRYEDAAREMQVKVQEHKNQLEEYEAHSYLYGKKAQDLQAHCEGLIRYYEQAAKANLSMADIHRKMAAEAK